MNDIDGFTWIDGGWAQSKITPSDDEGVYVYNFRTEQYDFHLGEIYNWRDYIPQEFVDRHDEMVRSGKTSQEAARIILERYTGTE